MESAPCTRSKWPKRKKKWQRVNAVVRRARVWLDTKFYVQLYVRILLLTQNCWSEGVYNPYYYSYPAGCAPRGEAKEGEMPNRIDQKQRSPFGSEISLWSSNKCQGPLLRTFLRKSRSERSYLCATICYVWGTATYVRAENCRFFANSSQTGVIIMHFLVNKQFWRSIPGHCSPCVLTHKNQQRLYVCRINSTVLFCTVQ
jgi:hypothetical protein